MLNKTTLLASSIILVFVGQDIYDQVRIFMSQQATPPLELILWLSVSGALWAMAGRVMYSPILANIVGYVAVKTSLVGANIAKGLVGVGDYGLVLDLLIIVVTFAIGSSLAARPKQRRK